MTLQNKLTSLLPKKKDVYPIELPIEYINKGIWDIHIFKLKPGT